MAWNGSSEVIVVTIAQGRIGGPLAPAQEDRAGAGRPPPHRADARAGVGAVADRLSAPAVPAAPEHQISFLDFPLVRSGLGYLGFEVHGDILRGSGPRGPSPCRGAGHAEPRWPAPAGIRGWRA